MTLAYRYADQDVPFEIRDGGAFWVHSHDPSVPIPCLWSEACPRDAVTGLAHPVLGHVPVCAECEALAARLAGPVAP